MLLGALFFTLLDIHHYTSFNKCDCNLTILLLYLHFINDMSTYYFYKQDENEHQTFVLKLNENGEIEYRNHGNPYKQIYKTMKKLSAFLNKQYFINSIIYFNYHNDKYHFVDGSDKTNGIIGINQKENLYDLLKNRMKNFKFEKLNEQQIKYLKQKFEKYKV